MLDASVGGLGGCPFAPKATGNIATEDLVYVLQGEGVETGIDLDALIAVSEWLEGVLGRQLEGQLYRAGSFPPAWGENISPLRIRHAGRSSPHLAELDVARPAAKDDLVAVLEERPLAPVAEADRMRSVLRELDEGALAAVLRSARSSRTRAGRRSASEAPLTVVCASCCGIVQ